MGPTSLWCHDPAQILFILIAVLLGARFATLAAEISGTIKHAEGGEPLGKIAVTVSGTSFNTVTSADGKFRNTWRLSVKSLCGSGFPVEVLPPTVLRLSPYERLDLRVDKSWLLNRWKLTLYGELLNVTNHYNPIFQGTLFAINAPPFIFTSQGVPVTPTVGLAFDF